MLAMIAVPAKMPSWRKS